MKSKLLARYLKDNLAVGFAAVYGDATHLDDERQYFAAQTHFGSLRAAFPLLRGHDWRRVIGRAALTAVDDGLRVTAEVWERAALADVQAGKLYFSVGTVRGAVKVAAGGRILTWPICEVSLGEYPLGGWNVPAVKSLYWVGGFRR